MTWRPISDWLILKPYSKVIHLNFIKIGAMNFCFEDSNNKNVFACEVGADKKAEPV